VPVTGGSSFGAIPLKDPGRRRLLFLGVLAALVTLVALSPVGMIRPLQDGTAAVTAALLRLAGVDVRLTGNMLHLDAGTLLITRDCTGLYLVAVFAALVVAYPAARRKCLGALSWGVPALAALNLVRLLGAGLILQYVPGAFSVVHDFLFQVVLMLSVLLLWFVWLSRLESGGSTNRPSDAGRP
jgi:archaeosortase B (VPXXXP-CTERM-specific)